MNTRRIGLTGLALGLAVVLLVALAACYPPSPTVQGIGGLNNPPSVLDDLTVADDLTIGDDLLVNGVLRVAASSTFSDSVRLRGNATDWEDLRIDGLSTRTGAVAPTDETGFRGSANFYSRNFVHNQADEVQFSVQMPHAWREESDVFPHVHFSPWASSSNTNTVQLVLDCYNADVRDTFPTPSVTYTMSYTWVGEGQWAHYIASNDAGYDMTGLGLSSILKCRLYRDNTVGDNYANKIAFLYFDIHYEVDSFGSDEEYIK